MRYVDPDSRELISQSEMILADVEVVCEEDSATQYLLANAETDHDRRKKSALY